MAIKDNLRLEGQCQRESELLHDSQLPLVRTMLVKYSTEFHLPRTESEMLTVLMQQAESVNSFPSFETPIPAVVLRV
jgi:hypothetical protein